MTEEDYPYIEALTDPTTGGCAHDDSKVAARISSYHKVDTDRDSIGTALQSHPLQVGFSTSEDLFYISGTQVLSHSSTQFCADYGHVVSIVGYNGCTGDCQDYEETTTTLKYRYLKNNFKRLRGCDSSASEWRCHDRYCCWYETTTQTVQNTAYFILQNQWSADWAD